VPFDKITFRDAKIQMEDDARIIALDRAYFYDCKFHSIGGGTPLGVVPLNICLFEDCQVIVPIHAQLHFFNTGKLYIRSSEILSGVTVWGQGYQILDSSLDGGFWGSGLESVASSLSNVILNSTFDNYRVYDQSFSDLNITKSTFINRDGSLADGAVIKEFGGLNLKCSTFINNKSGVVSSKLNSVSMSSLQNLGYNFFDNNETNISFWDSKGINLYEGYNEIYDGTYMNFDGTLDKDYYTPTPGGSPVCPGTVNASKNIWTPYSGGPPYPTPGSPDPALFDVRIMTPNQGGNIIHCQISFATSDIGTIVPCGELDRREGPKSNHSSAKNGSFSMPLVSSDTYFSDIPFDEALADASATTRSADSLNGDDALASSKFYELLTADLASVNDSIDSLVTFLRWTSLDQFKTLIEGMVTDSLISREANSTSFAPSIQEYVNTLMHYTDSVKTEENYKRQFSLEIKKLALFRLLGQDESALQIAINLSYCDHDSLQQFLIEEVIDVITYGLNAKEQGYLSFLYDSISYEVDSTIFNIPVESFVDSSGFGTYINGPSDLSFSSCALAFSNKALNPVGSEAKVRLYPNPASNEINVFINERENLKMKRSYSLEIMTLDGKQLLLTQISMQSGKIDISHLASGMYIYRVFDTLSSFSEEGKFVVER
ncbi:MAG: T9SS type A sorting domain-containing protein, partial [Cryomorphaceae bacterium]